MFLFTTFFGVVFLTFLVPVCSQKQPEPDCPRFDYEYKILERLIKLELAIQAGRGGGGGGGSADHLEQRVEDLAQKLDSNTVSLEGEIKKLKKKINGVSSDSDRKTQECKEKLEEFETSLEKLGEEIETLKGNMTRKVYYVTLHIFSGVPNPRATIEESDPRFQDLSLMFEDMPSSSLSEGLGYSGFSIQIWTGLGWFEKTVGKLYFPPLERKLFDLFPLVVDSLGSYIGDILDGLGQRSTTPRTTSIKTSTTTTTRRHSPSPSYHHYKFPVSTGPSTEWPYPTTTTRKPKKRCVLPKYEPGKWNVPGIQPNNNCYNYATNKITNTFAQPGRGSGRIYPRITGIDVRDAAVRDGLSTIRDPGAGRLPLTDNCLVALVIWPDVDFHWYRLDEGAKWSHKQGSTKAKDTDDSGRKIMDPRVADRGPYVKFTGFMSTHDGVTIR